MNNASFHIRHAAAQNRMAELVETLVAELPKRRPQLNVPVIAPLRRVYTTGKFGLKRNPGTIQ